MGTSWYFSWKLNYFGIPKWKQGLFNIPQSGHESVYLLEPSFHSRTPNNSTFRKNISWCPCLKGWVNFLPRRNYAAHFTVDCTTSLINRFAALVGWVCVGWETVARVTSDQEQAMHYANYVNDTIWWEWELPPLSQQCNGSPGDPALGGLSYH